MATDFYPTSMDARAAWHQNFAKFLPDIAAKYNIDAATLTQVDADNAWIQYWVNARHQADAQSEQLTKYFNTIAGKDTAAEPPAPVSFELPPGPPADVPPGMESRVREIARQIKGTAGYSPADGELVQIVGDEGEPVSFEDKPAQFTLKTLANFRVEATFRKFGADAMRFEFRHKGGEWQQAAYLVASPGSFAIVPATAGEAEQVEVRGILVKKNEDVGTFSDIVPVLIAP